MTDTVVITGARAPIALHLARLMKEDGLRVVLADTSRFPLARATRSQDAYERLPAPGDGLDAYAAALDGVIARHAPRLIVPTCEEVFHLAAVRDVAGLPIPLFAPSLATLAAVHHKGTFAGMAKGLGCEPPRTKVLMDRCDVLALGDASDLVFKPAWSRFGSRTLLAPNADALSGVRPTAADPWVAQDRMPGEEICATAVAVDGNVVALQAYEPLWRAGLGAGIAFAQVEDDRIAAFVTAICRKTAWTGQIAFDFKRDRDGLPRVLECNPRPTSGVHFFGPSSGFAGAILGRGSATAGRRRPATLPLAMATYGLRQAVSEGRLSEWWRDLRTMDDFAAWPGEGRLVGAQILALAEIAWTAARTGKSLQAASTADIEWNGAPFPTALRSQRHGHRA